MIPWAQPKLFGNEEALVLDALRSAWISGGPYVERLEYEAAERMGVAEALAVSNGTTALELALRGLDIGPGCEVIVPGFTFVAAANMVMAVGATPVYADVDPDTWLVDAAEIDRLAGPRTKAVLPVHLYGNIADMDAIMAVAEAHGLLVVEDAAEAAFSRHRGRCAGTIGTVGTFSLHATKTITSGEGGLVVTNDAELARRMRVLRDHGMRKDRRYWHDVVGFNFRLTNMQAALGCAQMEKLDEIIAERARIHARYRAALAGIGGVRLQHFAEATDPVLWAMTVQLVADDGTPYSGDVEPVRARRDAIMAGLLDDGIETRPGFYALSLMPPYDCPTLPNSLYASASILSPPTFPGLEDDAIDRICARLAHHLQKTS